MVLIKVTNKEVKYRDLWLRSAGANHETEASADWKSDIS